MQDGSTLSTATRSLLLVGTYGEKLGHVDGKGQGVYVLLLDRQSIRLVSGPPELAAPVPLLGVPQLGGADGMLNPTYIETYRAEPGAPLNVYIVDERYAPAEDGCLWAAVLDETTAALTKLGTHVGAGGHGSCHVAVAPGGRHVLVANYLSGTVSAVERRTDGSLGARSALIEL
eukprot:700724-Prymnesium_polylepis.1